MSATLLLVRVLDLVGKKDKNKRLAKQFETQGRVAFALASRLAGELKC